METHLESERYVQMGCCCGSEWIEDRLEPAATCPSCCLKLNWQKLAASDRMAIVGPGRIDMSPAEFQQVMETCSFTETKTPSRRSRYDSTIWTHLYSSPSTIWEITVEATSFKTEDQQLRSITFSLRLSGLPVLSTAIITADQLTFMLAAIARSMEAGSEERTPLAEGIFCGAPLAPLPA